MSKETSSLYKVFQYRILVELPWLISTLDTMKFAMMMERTVGSSQLTGLITQKSLSSKVIGGRLHCSGASKKLMLMSRMAFSGLAGLSSIGKSTCACGGCRSCCYCCCLCLPRSSAFLLSTSWFLCCSSWSPPGLAPAWWLFGLLTKWANYLTYISSSILSFRAQQSYVL